MNIFEEIAESYTYNGAVSLKALEDDIITLENTIDSYNSTLRELQLRGKKSLPLLEKLRDTKIRLSLLKAVYKRESDKATPDDVILNMLGISAKDANEIESPDTAAGNKEPVPQNFEEAEIEIVNDGEETNVIENEVITDKEIPVETVQNDANTDRKDVNIEQLKVADEHIHGVSVEKIPENNTEAIETSEIKAEDLSAVEYFEEKQVESKIIINEETGEIDLNRNSFTNPIEYFIPSEDNRKEMKEYYSNDSVDDKSFIPVDGQMIEGEQIPPEDDCPPPTMDDYLEPISDMEEVSAFETSEDTATEAVPCREDEMNEIQTFDSVTQDFDMEFDTYEAFPDEKVGIVASLDLCDVTNMVNTMYVYGNINSEKRLLNVRFMDVRDYEVFVGLLKEREETRHKLFGYFGKKPRSIFMYVTASVGEYKQEYVYEFTNCRVANVSDTEYASKACYEVPFEDCSYHNCYVTFKYKKLKINKK